MLLEEKICFNFVLYVIIMIIHYVYTGNIMQTTFTGEKMCIIT